MRGLDILLAPVLLVSCHAFRTNDATGAEQEVVPRQYVVPNSKLVDISGYFNGKVLMMHHVLYRCCKSDADGLGVLKAESADSSINSCSSLVGSGFKSFVHFPNPKCVVAYSALPSKVLPLVDSSNAKVVGELIDLSDVLMKGKGEVTLSNGRQVRCCTAQDAPASVLVEPKKENLLDGTALQKLHRIGSFNKKKCKGLLGKNYHSWEKWIGNRCFVMSQDIPSDILEVLKWNNAAVPVPPQQPEEPEQPVQLVQPVQPVSELPQPEPESSEADSSELASWQLTVRVVSATTQRTIGGVAVRILKEDRSFLSSGTSNDVGVVLFQVPSSELKVVVDAKAEGYAPNSRLYKWRNPQGRRSDCYGKKSCKTQMALNPN